MAENIHIKLEPDDYPEHPWLHAGLGFEWNFNHKKLKEDVSDGFPTDNLTDWWFFKVYMYDHSGFSLALKPFSCKWDSGVYGVVAVRRPSRGGRWHRREKFLKHLEECIENLSCWLNGDVHQYTVADDRGDILDACGGLYGREYAKEVAANSALMFLAAIPASQRGDLKWAC